MGARYTLAFSSLKPLAILTGYDIIITRNFGAIRLRQIVLAFGFGEIARRKKFKVGGHSFPPHYMGGTPARPLK